MLPRLSIDGVLFVRLAAHARSFAGGRLGATAGNVKRLLPPRQSRGISFVSLAGWLSLQSAVQWVMERVAVRSRSSQQVGQQWRRALACRKSLRGH
jgi:hypothetical protein